MRPSQMGRLQVDDFRLDEPIPYVAVPPRQGRPNRRRSPRARGDRRRPRLPRGSRVWSLVTQQRQQGPPSPRSTGWPAALHPLPDPALLRRRPSPYGNGRCRHPRPLRPHQPGNHHDLRAPRARKSIAPQWNDCVRAMASGQSRWPAYLRRHHPDERCQSQRQTANSDDRHCSSGTSASTSVLTRQHARKCRDDVTSPGAAAAPPLGTSFRISLTPTPAAPRPPAGQC